MKVLEEEIVQIKIIMSYYISKENNNYLGWTLINILGQIIVKEIKSIFKCKKDRESSYNFPGSGSDEFISEIRRRYG